MPVAVGVSRGGGRWADGHAAREPRSLTADEDERSRLCPPFGEDSADPSVAIWGVLSSSNRWLDGRWLDDLPIQLDSAFSWFLGFFCLLFYYGCLNRWDHDG